MENFSIQNKKGLKIVGEIYKPENPIGLSFVLHGLGGSKKQKQIQAIAQSFFNNRYTTVVFDTTNSVGESEGKYEEATMQSYYDDFVDVVEWSKRQDWYIEPFIISGTSLGGYSVLRYAEENTNKIKAVFSMAGIVSGQLSLERTLKFKPEKITQWKDTGWFEEESFSRPGLIKRLPWSHMEERLKHDLLPKILNITMPILVVVGSNDLSHIQDQEILMNALSENTKKELHFVDGAPHTFKEESHINELKNILDSWIKKLK